MENITADIVAMLREHLAKTEVDPLGSMGVFHCRRQQRLHRVPVHQPSLVLVFKGEKKIVLTATSETIPAGSMAMLPAGSDVNIENLPCPRDQEYIALSVGFAEATVKRFLDGFGSQIDWQQQKPRFNGSIPEPLASAVAQNLRDRIDGRQPSALVAEVKQQELLAICGDFGLLGFLASNNHGDWKQRVATIVSLDLAFNWRIQDLCQRLGVSESVLRRNLQAEATSYREILEQARLVTALALLQETPIAIAQVAAQVGYQSQSGFTERFKQRFGLTPSQLKATRKKQTSSSSLTETS